MKLFPSLRSRVLWFSEASYHQECLCALLHSSFPRPYCYKHSHSMLLKPPCFALEMVLAWWWAVPGFLQTWHLAFRLKSSSDQKTLFLIVWESFRCLLANSRSAVMCFHLANLPWWMQRWLFSWTGLLSPQSWSFVIVTIDFLVTCLTKAFLPLSLRVARSKKSLPGSKLLPFMEDGGLCAYWELPQICGLILSQRSKDNWTIKNYGFAQINSLILTSCEFICFVSKKWASLAHQLVLNSFYEVLHVPSEWIEMNTSILIAGANNGLIPYTQYRTRAWLVCPTTTRLAGLCTWIRKGEITADCNLQFTDI